jgi:hypothetical protein
LNRFPIVKLDGWHQSDQLRATSGDKGRSPGVLGQGREPPPRLSAYALAPASAIRTSWGSPVDQLRGGHPELSLRGRSSTIIDNNGDTTPRTARFLARRDPFRRGVSRTGGRQKDSLAAPFNKHRNRSPSPRVPRPPRHLPGVAKRGRSAGLLDANPTPPTVSQPCTGSLRFHSAAVLEFGLPGSS